MLTFVYWLITILILAAVAIVAYAALQPGAFSVKRALRMTAPPEKIFPLINDFSLWPKWSPWEKLDPGMTRTMSAVPSGKGATYAWQGTKAGAGRMEILDTTPNARIDIRLNYIKPFKAENRTVFLLSVRGEETEVSWEMSGTKNLVMKIFGLFMNMDKLVGGDFEKGLAAMKAEVEQV